MSRILPIIMAFLWGCLPNTPAHPACDSNNDCLEGRMCRPSTQTCGGPLAVGSPCLHDFECGSVATCVDTEVGQQCLIGVAQTCTPGIHRTCGPGLRCAAEGVCVAAYAAGDVCVFDSDCDSLSGPLRCVEFDGQMSCARPVDGACNEGELCSPGQACIAGLCDEPAVVDLLSPCRADGVCASGYCERGRNPERLGSCRTPEGGLCQRNADCGDGHVCRPVEPDRELTCEREPAGPGASCTAHEQCDSALGLTCTAKVCSLSLLAACTPGDPLRPCAPGTACACGSCRLPASQEGACCETDEHCSSLLWCDEGHCQTRGGLGHACDFRGPSTPPCADGLACIAGHCREE